MPSSAPWQVVQGDALDVLKTLRAECIDALVTDPPAGIGFMGREWDSNKGGREEWIAWLRSVMVECLRVMKPGAHGLVWAIPRTSHWTGMALELAGFEVRDRITHLFGTGFPKSRNLGNGRGTALKPQAEDWWLVKKPGKGGAGLAIDASRVGGRWPGHVVLSHDPGCVPGACFDTCAVRLLNDETADLRGGGRAPPETLGPARAVSPLNLGPRGAWEPYGDSGGASRFHYCAKPGTAEREDGCHELPIHNITERREGSAGKKNPRAGAGRTGGRHNPHPTVKATDLMVWLTRLITPAGGVVLDPFAGSGTTGRACRVLGLPFLGIERDPTYIEVAKKRIAALNRFS